MAEQKAFHACANPELCAQEFQHIKTELSELGEKVDIMNQKLFESNGISYATRVALMEEWIKNEVQTRAFLNKWFYGIVAALIIQISLGVWNRIEILKSGSNITTISQQLATDEGKANP